jgi:lipoprotein-releasing system permease protein
VSYENFIARKILSRKAGRRKLGNPVIRIATGGIALGMAVMIIAVMVVTGFRNEITKKVTGFGAHIRLNNFDSNNSFEEIPVDLNQEMLNQLRNDPDVRHVQLYGTKAGIIKTDEEIQGIVLKGVDSTYDWNFFKDKIIEGKLLNTNTSPVANEVMISSFTARQLKLKTGDEMVVYFIEQPPRIRKFTITGIYETGLEEFDNLYVYCDLEIIRKLNSWKENQAGGLEILVNDFKQLESVSSRVYERAGYQYYTQSIFEQYPQIFHWLDLQNINVMIIITLILMIAGISMISTLLIIILDNTALTGVLKAMGATDKSIRNIFIRIAIPVIGTGILAGNVLGLLLCFIQWKFGIVTLPQESYYVSAVPVNFSLPYLLLLNAGTLLTCFLMLIGPSLVITKIDPSRILRFD